MGSRIRTLLLRGLEYPSVETFEVEDTGKFQELVLWLEDTKIRFYKPDERTKLRATDAHAEWEAAFSKFLGDMGCDIESTVKNRGKIMDYMLFQAVGFNYKDEAARLNALAGKLKPPEPAASSASQVNKGKRSRAQMQSQAAQPNFDQLDTPEFLGALTKLAELLKVPVRSDEPAKLLKATLGAAQRVLAPAVLEAAAAADQLTANQPNGEKLFGLAKSSFPLGFDLGDAELEAVSILLRVLYVNDLRALQSQIDHFIVEMQEITADPKTDAKLGRVGV
mmetsp:Transcript_32373/g.54325  ORF Transcript_32373/g.54325 Transcript_32373/m.54325 type:complete len:279 (+) Transcript_32373:163-999(+)|eukprot:CAMPEP_0198205984 /NCGR_PEP_ID=MMETSP1445-20131203/9510_1 /TAXON_ID=36898 /ORGANISM="Pyramimonas sp., Strain CCMP2087" /LENGTH=278 /DNA_ID=CAMNT_0043878493 /DNA_START=163 /DNA_END=999 /DNA_ORIENTATION=-